MIMVVSKWEIKLHSNGFHFLEKENPMYSVSTHTYEQEKGEEDGPRLFSLVTLEVRIITFFNHFYYEC